MIEKIAKSDVVRCADILYESEIGSRYYPRKELLVSTLEQSLQSDEIYCYKDKKGEIQGVIWYQHAGMFNTYPYLHMIAVDNNCRHMGIGKQLLEHFEKESLQAGANKIRTKAFLLVAHDNEVAQMMYEQAGYEEITEISSLFRIRMDEKLLYKVVV
ncbi:MAG: GNAT family N-acetyltransferase [Pseudobutyrivibrio sp.]|nr:GNAT family N-acetyltransferase [Pseudobutyrivibrio sp.]